MYMYNMNRKNKLTEDSRMLTKYNIIIASFVDNLIFAMNK